MTLIRYTLIVVAVMTGSGAAAAWILAQPHRAGILAAICAACVLIAEGIGYCQRRSWERARRVREQVWARRDAECYGAVWPSDVGSPE